MMDKFEKTKYLSDSDITNLLNISQNTLNNKIYKGDDLPPFLKPKGCRKRIWLEKDVIDWLCKNED